MPRHDKDKNTSVNSEGPPCTRAPDGEFRFKDKSRTVADDTVKFVSKSTAPLQCPPPNTRDVEAATCKHALSNDEDYTKPATIVTVDPPTRDKDKLPSVNSEDLPCTRSM